MPEANTLQQWEYQVQDFYGAGLPTEYMNGFGQPFEQYVHAENASKIVMMCDHYQREYVFEEMGDGWLNLKVK